jgi:hypothetical protein
MILKVLITSIKMTIYNSYKMSQVFIKASSQLKPLRNVSKPTKAKEGKINLKQKQKTLKL